MEKKLKGGKQIKMPIEMITIPRYRCERCGHRWIPRGNETPLKCPHCNSPYWNRPRKNNVSAEER